MVSESLLPGVFASIDVKGPVLDYVMALPKSALQKNGMMYAIDTDSDTLVPFTPEILFDDGNVLFIKPIANQATIVTSPVAGGDMGMAVRYNLAAEPIAADTSGPQAGLMYQPQSTMRSYE